jgi:hypothetical protein
MMEQSGPATLDEALALAIDEDFYVFTYGELPPGSSASSHYATVGWRDGYDPNPWFSTQSYLDENPDVADAEMVPLFHFLEYGAGEGRAVKPSHLASAYFSRELTAPHVADYLAPSLTSEENYERTVVQAEFDADYYLALNPDVQESGFAPLSHFMEFGWREGRDPNAFFSTKTYMEENPDVASSGINPFYHYIVAGRAEGRAPRPALGFRYDILRDQTTLEQRMASAMQVAPWRLGSRHQFHHAIDTLTRSGKRQLFVSISHDDFTENVGGVQLCLRREADAFEQRDFDQIHLFPGRTFLVTNHEDDDPPTGMLVNGQYAGHFRGSCIAEALAETIDTEKAWQNRSFSVHSLLGHNVESLTEILKALRLERGYFWIHDYASVCAGLQLLRNDVQFCGAPPPQSTTCEICIYGERRHTQLSDHADFFREFSLTVVAPSQTALETWKNGTDLVARDGERVHPHCTLVPVGETRHARRAGHTPLRVAFLGYPALHKGWLVFRDLALRFAGDRRFEFYHLGMQRQPRLPVRYEEVRVESSSMEAMVDKVAELEIDVAVIWSLWPETFCFTAYEAVAGGAAVIAPQSSGNVARMIEETGKGLVLADEEALMKAFESDAVQALHRDNRKVELFRMEFGGMTADLVKTSP